MNIIRVLTCLYSAVVCTVQDGLSRRKVSHNDSVRQTCAFAASISKSVWGVWMMADCGTAAQALVDHPIDSADDQTVLYVIQLHTDGDLVGAFVLPMRQGVIDST